MSNGKITRQELSQDLNEELYNFVLKDGTVAMTELTIGDREGVSKSGINSFAQGFGVTASGNYSHAEGFASVAYGEGSHAEGYQTAVYGDYSHVEGINSIVINGYHSTRASTEGWQGDPNKIFINNASSLFAVGDSVYFLQNGKEDIVEAVTTTYINVSNPSDTIPLYYNEHDFNVIKIGSNLDLTASHAEGDSCMVFSHGAHAEGVETIASGGGSHAEGRQTLASANSSHAEGSNTTASGMYSHAGGNATIASGNASCAKGNYTTASVFASHSQGQFNKVMTGSTSSFATTNTAFVIGNGTGASTLSNAFRVMFNGATYGLSAFNSTGADYAEFFEWADGNLKEEDRVGFVVTMDGDKIRKATENDSYILGIISANPSVIGDSYQDDWSGKYLLDEWGRIQYHYVDVKYTELDENYEEIIVTKKEYHPIYNSNWDSSTEYISREQRREWDAVGLVGKLYVRDDGTCLVNGFAKVGAIDGELTLSDEQTNMRVMERVSSNIIRVFVK